MNKDIQPQRHFFTKMRLHSLKHTLIWGGVVITLGGIVFGVANGGSRDGAYLSLFGLLLTCFSHLVADALAKHQAAEQKADRHRQADTLQASLDGAYILPMPEEEAKIRQRIKDLRRDA